MFVEPNSTVKLMKRVPLDPKYEDTYRFDSLAEQTAFFREFERDYLTFEKQTYQRYTLGSIKLKVKQEDVYDCNYMSFQNVNHSDKIFYAFVIETEYINENTTAIYYSIDEMQTWYFNYTLQECYIERQHSETDNIGDNLQAEPVPLGEYNKVRIETDFSMLTPVIALYYSTDPDGTATSGDITNGIYTGCRKRVFPYNNTGFAQLNSVLDAYSTNARTASIISVEMQPILATYEGGYRDIPIYKPTGNENFDGYLPKNKKLYVYPYNYLVVHSPDNDISLAYEYFSTSNCKFRIACAGTPNDGVQCRPLDYMGQNVGIEAATISRYPAIMYQTNSYEEFWARQRATLAPRLIGAGIAVAETAITLGASNAVQGAYTQQYSSNMGLRYAHMSRAIPPNKLLAQYNLSRQQDVELNALLDVDNARRNYNGVQAASSTIHGVLDDILSTWAQSNLEKLNPLSTRGISGDYTDYLIGEYTFKFLRLSIMREFAEKIDKFFTLYGYAQNTIGVPNRSARQNWCYIKTSGCKISGAKMPQSSVVAIENIYNKGIRFWNKSHDIGNYEDGYNPPIGG